MRRRQILQAKAEAEKLEADKAKEERPDACPTCGRKYPGRPKKK